MDISSCKPLQPHEWFAVTVYITLFLFMVLLSFINGGMQTLEVLPQNHLENTLCVYIKGAVQKPGCYRLKKGSSLNEALALAGLLKDADLSRVDLKEEVVDGKRIKIKEQKKIPLEVIYKSRGGEKEVVWVAIHSRIEELKDSLRLKKGEAIHFPKRRKILKKNDQIIVEKTSIF